jgi:hypothetical protein
VIYMTGTDGITVVVLEPANIEELKKGRPARSPDGKVVICYTPDAVWLSAKLSSLTSGDAQEVARLIDESQNRPERNRENRKPHEPYIHKFLQDD